MLTSLIPGSVHAIICDTDCAFGEVVDCLFGTRNTLVIAQPDSPDSSRIVAVSLDALANKARVCWPDWYENGGFTDGAGVSLDERFRTLSAIADYCRDNRRIDPIWLKAATACAAMDKSPRVDGFVDEIQAAQLSLVLAGRLEALFLTFSPDYATFSYVGGIAKAAEWLARETRLPILTLIPPALAERDELAPLMFDRLIWPASAKEQGSRSFLRKSKPPPDPTACPEKSETAAKKTGKESVIGQPHPGSPGELLLADCLPRDDRLRGLFHYNQPVAARNGVVYHVDLLWPEGKLIVEVDGYAYHWKEVHFSADRKRDYDLHISGYRVIRLTSKEILRDPGLAVEKIFAFVSYLRNEEGGRLEHGSQTS